MQAMGLFVLSPRKIRKLAFLTNGEKSRTTWIRLGVNPAYYENGKDAWGKNIPKTARIVQKNSKRTR